eukprot:scaffold16942_cov118-Isochrysis_galbana.AAC.4
MYTCRFASLQHFFETNTSAQNHPHSSYLASAIQAAYFTHPSSTSSLYRSFLFGRRSSSDRRMIPRGLVRGSLTYAYLLVGRWGSVSFIVLYPRPRASHNPLVEGCSMIGAAWTWLVVYSAVDDSYAYNCCTIQRKQRAGLMGT